ncbi:MAG: multidrug effflux MFS transporter [Aestuariivita sp.]|nr:multidrug effflux MFS transporter [Aestuariivita sp.]MCY4203422.1 multidrug effflux MFS transporter [Aestuariivita sp.]MCY4287249.1 multidrug effflux MFS transporter [Aestuariivita sp.]MCY4347476.1 multidrug effflux MFS transporter [Aestuariivita sp.]
MNTSPPHLTTLIFLTALSAISVNMFLPSLGNIATTFETSYGTVSWAISGFLIVTAIIQIVAGPWSDRIGRRPVVIMSLMMFTVASLGCTLAQDIETFLFCRILQGSIVSGAVLSFAIVRDTRSERQAVSLIGYIGMAMAIGPILGPLFGGILDTIFGWRSIFVLFTLTGLVLLFLCWFDLGETKSTAVQIEKKHSSLIIILLREPLFWAFALCRSFTVGAFYIFLTGTAIVAQSAFGFSTNQLGFYLGTITLGYMCGSFVTGKLGVHLDTVKLMIAGRILAFLALVTGITLWQFGLTVSHLFFVSTALVGFGNGLTVPSSNAGAMSVRSDLVGTSAGLTGAMVVLLGAVFTLLTGYSVTELTSPKIVLLLMLITVSLSFAFALWAFQLRRYRD